MRVFTGRKKVIIDVDVVDVLLLQNFLTDREKSTFS